MSVHHVNKKPSRLNISQLNCRGMRHKIDEITDLLNKHDIHVAAFSETKVTANTVIDLPNYEIIRLDCDRAIYGSAIAIKKGISFTCEQCLLLTDENTMAEIITISIDVCLSDKVHITCMYNAPGKTLPKHQMIKQMIPKNSILIGDLNSKHEDFGCRSTDRSGEDLLALIEKQDWVLHNDRQPTYICTRHSGYAEILDLVITNAHFAQFITEVDVLDDVGSDHFASPK